MVGKVQIGGDAPVAVQSMTKTDTTDVDGTIKQIEEMTAAGCEIVRIAVPDKDAGLAGPIGIVQIISKVVQEQGFIGLISILALISLNLGVFNLLPIPMLDGGQIAVLAIEGFLGLFGLTLSMNVKEKIQLVGLAVILLLMVTTIFFDISRLFGK